MTGGEGKRPRSTKRRRHLSLADALRWRGFEIGVAVVNACPDVSMHLAPLVGELTYRLAPRARRAVRANVRVVRPNVSPAAIEATVRAVFRSVCRYYVDLLRLPAMDAHALNSRLTVEGYEHYLAAHAEGRGVVFASVHVGPAEIPLLALGARGFRYTAVVEQVQPPQLAELLRRVREAHGQRYVYPTLAGARELLRTLRAGGTVAMLVDRDVLGNGVPAAYFGRELRAPSGPVELASATRAPIVGGVARRLPGGRYHITILPAYRVTRRIRDPETRRAEVERLLALYEPFVRRYAEEWIVLQRLWP